MPIPLAIPLAVAGASALYQGISGAVQTSKAKKELEAMGERPDYTIPAGVQAASALSSRMAQEGIPQAAMNMFDAQQNQMQAQTASNMGDLRAGLSGVQGAAGAGSQAARQLAIQDAQQRIVNQRANMQQQNLLAQYQEKAQMENELGRYDVARAEALGRLDRGQAEKMAALQSLTNTAGAALMAPEGTFDMFNKTVVDSSGADSGFDDVNLLPLSIASATSGLGLGFGKNAVTQDTIQSLGRTTAASAAGLGFGSATSFNNAPLFDPTAFAGALSGFGSTPIPKGE